MRLDHLSFAAGPDGLAGTAQRIGELLGTSFVDGGVHPRFGTRNMILPLSGDTYLEIVEVLDHPASDKAPFGQAVRARSALGGGWLGWVVAVDDISLLEQRLGREAVLRQPAPPRRHRAALAADRRQRPDLRPAAAVLHRVGVAGRAAPERGRRRRSPWPAWRSPVTRSGSASGSASRSRRRWRTSRSSGSPRNGTPGMLRRRRSRPRRVSSGSDRCRPVCPGLGRAPTSGTTPRRTRSRTAPPTPTAGCGRRCSSRSAHWTLGPRRARPRLRHRLPPAAVRRVARPRSSASSRTRTSWRWPGVVPARCRTCRCRPAWPSRCPLPDASVDVVHARWAYFFGPGCEPGLAELDRVVRRGGTALVDRQRPDPVDVRRLVPARLPGGRPGRRRAVLVDARLDPDPGRHGLALHLARRPGGRRTHRAHPRGRRRRCSPSTRAPRSTTRSTCGRSGSDVRRIPGCRGLRRALHRNLG